MTVLNETTTTPFLPLVEYFPTNNQANLVERLQYSYSTVAKAVNQRDISIYDFTENPSGQIWFGSTDTSPKRYGFRRVFYFPALTNFAVNPTTSQAHNMGSILPTILITSIRGATTHYAAGPVFMSQPIPTSGGNPLTVWLDATNIYIQQTNNFSDGHQAVVVVEYIVGN